MSNCDVLVHIDESYGVIIHMAYATTRNFMKKQVYAEPNCYLHKDAVKSLKIAISIAGALGFKLKIYDAFRPINAQKILWEIFPDASYIANPYVDKDSLKLPHCRGIALDLTLVDAETAKELPMGTTVDTLTELSHPAATAVDDESLKNRMILCGIMVAAGFDHLVTEWWHFQMPNYRSKYPVLEGCENLLGGILAGNIKLG